MQRARGIDVVFLVGETRAWHMHVCGLAILDPSTAVRGFAPERFPELLADRLAAAPQFTWKLREVPLGLDPPVFVTDPDFRIERHFHRTSLAPPGDRLQLSRLIGEIAARKLDRSRPLWEVWTIEGLEGGLVAIMTKINHSLIDGASGADLAGLMMDVSSEPQPHEPAEPLPADRPSPTAALVAHGLLSGLAAPSRLARYTWQLAGQGAAAARQLAGHTRAGLPFQAPPTPWNARLGPHRSFAFADVALADVRTVKSATGVTVNDVVLTVLGGALRTYLSGLDRLPDRPLIAQVPVSRRTDANRAEVRTLVGTMFASLGTHIEDPLERLAAVSASASGAKNLRSELAAKQSMSLADVPPPALISVFAHAMSDLGLEGWMPPVFNLIVSNVPGPPFPLFMGGARILAVYPLGPLLYGAGLNATVFTLDGTMHVGFLADRDLVPDPWLIADQVPVALAELLEAVAPPRRRHRTSRPRRPRTPRQARAPRQPRAAGQPQGAHHAVRTDP